MRKYILLATCLIVISGCSSIPSEAPELSGELGKRISALEQANITLLNRYFDHKRLDVDRFIQDIWLPEFADNLFKKPLIANAWNIIVVENNKQKRLNFLINIGPKLQQAVNKKRIELIQPLNELERHIARNINIEYQQARSINNSITTFLISSSEITENRARYLTMMGLTDNKISILIDKTDSAMNNLLATGNKANNKTDSIDKFISKIKAIKQSL